MNSSFRTALVVTVGLLAGCAGKTEPDSDAVPENAKIPDRPLPTVNVASCSESGIDMNLTPVEIEDARTSADASSLYAQFSDCPASSAVRVTSGSKIKISFDRPRSLLAFGPGYFPTRGELMPAGVLKEGMPDAYLGAYVLPEHIWRPRLPGYRTNAPSLVMIVRGPGTTPLPTSSTCADPNVHVDAPSATVTHPDSGIIVVDGLAAGPAPRIDITPPSGCTVERVSQVAPLENGVVSLQFVMMK